MRYEIKTKYGNVVIKPSSIRPLIIMVVNDEYEQTNTVLTLDKALEVIEALRASIEERQG